MKRDEEEAKRDEEEAEAVVIRHELAFWISLAVRISFTKPDWVCPISLEEINIPTYVATNDDNIESEIVDIVNDDHADPNDMYDYYGSMAYEYSP